MGAGGAGNVGGEGGEGSESRVVASCWKKGLCSKIVQVTDFCLSAWYLLICVLGLQPQPDVLHTRHYRSIN